MRVIDRYVYFTRLAIVLELLLPGSNPLRTVRHSIFGWTPSSLLRYQTHNFDSSYSSISEGTVAPGSAYEDWCASTLQTLDNDGEKLMPIAIDKALSQCTGTIGKNDVTYRASAFRSKSLRYLRVVSFVGEGYDVFNLLAVPKSGVDLPILGIDIVSLPRKLHSSHD
jgi:Ferredoxin-dependent bilin reductase